jgi:hypothetical protein
MRTLALLLFVSANILAQLAPTSCSLDGTVVNSLTGAPVARAHISIVETDDTFSTASGFAESDVSGKWSAGHVPCGRVTVAVNRVGFRRSRKSPLDPNVLLVANSPIHDVKLILAPQAVLAGRVVDDEGDPIINAQVSLMTARVINGIRGVQASTSAMTDDRGEYRFAGLPDGKYILCANSGGGVVVNGGARAYGDKCYPGPANSNPSSTLDVPEGYEGRIDFVLSPLITVRVGGVVSGQPDGTGATVNLIPRTQIVRMLMGLSAHVQPGGTFTIGNVPPGSYIASATAGELKGRMPIEVGNSDVGGVRLHLEAGVTITGTVKVESVGQRKLEHTQYLVLLRNLDPGGIAGSQGTVWSENKASFTVPGLPVGNYRLELSPPAPFYVKSATLDGRDISNSEFSVAPGVGNIELILADDGGIVEGDVSTDDGPSPAWVFVQKDGLPSRNARADANGHFRIDTVPPGDYKVYAWDDNTSVEYANPDWMQRNGHGVAVTVAAGQTAQVKLTRQTAPGE